MQQRKSVYKYAAEAGLPIGCYMTLLYACFLLSVRWDFLSLLMFPLMLLFPFVLGYMMRRMATTEPGYNRFSPMWLFGIYTVIFGTLIASLFSSLYLTFVDPGFVNTYISNTIAIIESSPMAAEYEATTDMMRRALDSHQVPSGLQFVTTMGWCVCFSGSMLSLVLSFILSRRKSRDTALRM